MRAAAGRAVGSARRADDFHASEAARERCILHTFARRQLRLYAAISAGVAARQRWRPLDMIGLLECRLAHAATMVGAREAAFAAIRLAPTSKRRMHAASHFVGRCYDIRCSILPRDFRAASVRAFRLLSPFSRASTCGRLSARAIACLRRQPAQVERASNRDASHATIIHANTHGNGLTCTP